MTKSWTSFFKKFIRMDCSYQIIWLSKLLYIISMMARITYEAGTEKVNYPELLRKYNELLHRISTQLMLIAESKNDRMPDNIFFDMISEEITSLGISDSVSKFLNQQTMN